MKFQVTLCAVVVGGILLSGCGTPSNNASGNAAGSNRANQTQSTSNAGRSENQPVTVKAGVLQLLSVATQLKTAIQNGDTVQIQTTGPKLEDTWSQFEDQVKPKYPDLYDQVEQYLDPAVAGSKMASPNKQALGKLVDHLIQTLNQLSSKVGS